MSETLVTSAPTRRRGVVGTIFGFFLTRIVLMSIALAAGEVGVAILHDAYFKRRLPLPYFPIADLILTGGLAIGLVGVYALLVRLFERRWPAEARPRPGLAALGIVVGAGLFCAVYAILTMLGAAHFGGVNGLTGVAPIAALSLLAAFGEELVFRGVLFRTLEDSFGTTVAMVVSAGVFGGLHALNPGATFVSTVAIMLEAGLLLAAAYAWSRNLWLVFGLHFAWNFTEGGVFGAAVSGGRQVGLLNYPLNQGAGELITGGKFGPEASLVTVGVCLASALLFMVLAARKGNWRKGRMRWVLPRG